MPSQKFIQSTFNSHGYFADNTTAAITSVVIKSRAVSTLSQLSAKTNRETNKQNIDDILPWGTYIHSPRLEELKATTNDEFRRSTDYTERWIAAQKDRESTARTFKTWVAARCAEMAAFKSSRRRDYYGKDREDVVKDVAYDRAIKVKLDLVDRPAENTEKSDPRENTGEAVEDRKRVKTGTGAESRDRVDVG